MQAGNQEDGARLLVPGKMEAGAMGKTKASRKLQVLLVSGSVPALGQSLWGAAVEAHPSFMETGGEQAGAGVQVLALCAMYVLVKK